MDKKIDADQHFINLVLMLASACWQQLGKIPNPLDGKAAKDLNHAKITIDILMMIKDKTKGNLTADEERLIQNTISDLQLNYSDEVLKGDPRGTN